MEGGEGMSKCVGGECWEGGGLLSRDRGEIYFNRRASWFHTNPFQKKSILFPTLAGFYIRVNLSPFH